MPKAKDKSKLFCSFCRKTAKEVPSLIAGPGVHICGDCVKICNSILAGLPADGFGGWNQLADDKLLDNLERSQAAFEASRAVLQQQIDTLRSRDVSWQKIGEALGVSRQAAWERFG
jgi:ATP-dependent protease Clp ATPase subunit